MKATKKPVTIECFKYDGDLKNSNGEYYVPDWAKEAYEKGILYFGSKNEGEPPCELFVITNHGAVHVAVDDYVIRQIDGELYPCKPEVFEKTYDIETSDKPNACVPDDNEYGFTHDFAWALRMLKKGCRIHRSGWNGKGMFAVLQKGYPNGIPCNKQTAEAWGLNEGDLFKVEPYMQLKMVNGSHSMWVPSVNDCLSNDWAITK